MAFHPSTGGIGALSALNRASIGGIDKPISNDALITKLVGMTPQERAHFATINADDPIKLSAAKYVDNQLKAQATQLIAQQIQTAPPPVNQQVVASMAGAPQEMTQGLPENSGIAQLPAPNMQKMAGGGIVAFADGGFNNELFRKFLDSLGKTTAEFANADPTTKKGLLDAFGKATSGPQLPVGSTVPTATATPAVPGQSYAQMMESNPTMASRALNATRAGIANPMGAGIAATGGALSALGTNYLNRLSDEGLDTMSNAGGGDDTALAAAILREGRNNPTPPAPAKPGDYRGSKAVPYAGESAQAFSPSAAALRGGASTQARQNTRPGAAPLVDTGAARTAPATAAGSNKTQEQPEETTDAMFKRILGATPDPRSNLPKEIQEAEDLRVGQGNKVLESEKTAQAGLAALNDKRGLRIAEREKRLADKSGNDINMSLIDAGLAMMQSRGQGLSGIAEGAGVGMKRYTEESRLTEAARQKVEEARDAYDDLKFNREDMSRKQILAAENSITDARVATKTANIAEISRREGVNLKVAEHVYDAEAAKRLQAQNQKFQIQQDTLKMNNALQVAGINANAGTAAKIGMLEKLGAADPKSPLYRGYLMTVQEDKEPRLYSDYQTKAFDPTQGEAFKKQYPTFELYKAGMSGGGGGNFVKPPAGAAAPIYTR